VNLSRRSYLAAERVHGLLARVGLWRLAPVRVLARVGRRRLFGVAGAERAIRVRAHGLILQVPAPFVSHYVRDEYEPLTVDWLRGVVAPGMRVADVGAHIGYFSLLLSQLVGESGTVHAVEPAEENVRFLEQNVAANRLRNVEVIAAAAGAVSRRRTLIVTGSSDSHGFYEHPRTAAAATIEVDEVPLDELFGGSLDFAKIDVEGAELEVLLGMERLIDESPDLRLVVEWNPQCLHAAGRDAFELPRLLRRQGFDLTVVDDRARRRATVENVLADLEAGRLPSDWYGNLLCSRAAAG
jgi:FkbM family methyltransferase